MAHDDSVRKRDTERQFVTLSFATLGQRDGLEIVHEAARLMGVKTRTYIRECAIRCALGDIASHKAANRARRRAS